MIKNLSDTFKSSFTVVLRNQNLSPDGKTLPEHKNHHIKNGSNRGGTEFDFAQSSQEGSISESDKLLNNHPGKNGIRNLPNSFISKCHEITHHNLKTKKKYHGKE